MASIRPFKAIRPSLDYQNIIPALPYDVYSRKEAKEYVKSHSHTFLEIDRPETLFDDDFDMYSTQAYEKAASVLKEWRDEGSFIQDSDNCFYVYELTMDERTQTGLVALASVDDYLNNVIKKHENTRADKEIDRINHVNTLNAQTGPIFLAYRYDAIISDIICKAKKCNPVYDVTFEDNVRHRVWIIDSDDDIRAISDVFAKMESIYIADGHHRCASAAKVSLLRRESDKERPKDSVMEYDGFLSVLFPDSELKILDYNRVVKDLNGLSESEFLERIAEIYEIEDNGNSQPGLLEKGECGLFLGDKWYKLKIKSEYVIDDPVEGLDVALLQKYVMDAILDIRDPKTDKRIDFVGGIRGLGELEKRVHTDCACAFAMYPTSIDELFCVADAGLLMPPKSTWFEPKLRSGFFVHDIS